MPVYRWPANRLEPSDIVTLHGHAVLVDAVLLVGRRLWVIDADCHVHEAEEDEMVTVWAQEPAPEGVE